jgi:hypothetical protein
MDGDFQPLSSHNHLAQRFRAITENSTHYNRNARSGHGTPTHVSYINEPRRLSLQSNVKPATSDLESSTQALKSLLSINSPPSHPQPSNAIPPLPPPSSSPYKGPPSPRLIQHHRTRSAVNPLRTGSSPNLNGVQPARRVFSTSGVAPDGLTRPNQERQLPASLGIDEGSDEERAIKMEKELRKVLNLS